MNVKEIKFSFSIFHSNHSLAKYLINLRDYLFLNFHEITRLCIFIKRQHISWTSIPYRQLSPMLHRIVLHWKSMFIHFCTFLPVSIVRFQLKQLNGSSSDSFASLLPIIFAIFHSFSAVSSIFSILMAFISIFCSLFCSLHLWAHYRTLKLLKWIEEKQVAWTVCFLLQFLPPTLFSELAFFKIFDVSFKCLFKCEMHGENRELNENPVIMQHNKNIV